MFETLEIGLGLQIVECFQSWGQGFIWYLLAPLHYLGEETGYLLLLPVLYWSVHKESGKKLFILALSTAFISTIFKNWWQRPRPFHVAPNRISPIYQPESFGLPSGHTMFGTVLGIGVIKEVKKRWVTIAMLVFIMLMGLSRMIHGVHYPQDVVVGLLIGTAYVSLFYLIYDPISVALARCSMAQKFLFVILGLALVFILVTLIHHEYETRKSFLSMSGALAGGLTGLILEHKFLNFKIKNAVCMRILSSAVGLVTLLAVYFLLTFGFYSIVGKSTTIPVLILYVFRYGLVGFWVTFCVPWLLKKIKLIN